jgi:hypothetical protein
MMVNSAIATVVAAKIFVSIGVVPKVKMGNGELGIGNGELGIEEKGFSFLCCEMKAHRCLGS